MKFKAELRNVRVFSKLVAALSALDKIVWIRLEDEVVRFIVVPDRGSQVWCTFSRDFFFDPDAFVLKSLNAGNAIDLEITLAALQRALRSALQSSTDPVLRLAKRDNVPVLSMTIPTMTNPRGLGAFGFGPVGGGGQHGTGTGAGRYRESTFGSIGNFDQATGHMGGASSSRSSSSSHYLGSSELELLAKREREKVVVQDMPVRVMTAEAMASVLEPSVPEGDVNIVLPPLLQLKAVSDRFTKLAHAGNNSSGSGSLMGAPSGSGFGNGLGTGFGNGFGTSGTGAVGGAGTGTGATSGTSPKLELSANMYGVLRLRLLMDTLNVETVWTHLENPPLNEDALPIPLAEHPSTRYREAGAEKFATVRVDGRDWSRVLSVGRLDGRVIASVIDNTALILHVDVSQPDGPDDPDEISSITYYVSSYSV